MSDEQLEEATGGWNTTRPVYYVFCRECRSAFCCYNDEQVKQIVTKPLPLLRSPKHLPVYRTPNLWSSARRVLGLGAARAYTADGISDRSVSK